jgi:hypothetical protein
VWLRSGLALFLVATVATAHAGKTDADGWEQISDKDGVRVFRRSVPGSPLKSMRGMGIVDVPPATVALVLLDDDRAPEWVDSLAESKVVRVSSPYDYIEYNHIAMPALIRDREFVTHVTMSVRRDQQTAYIRSEPAADDNVSPRPKIIRGRLSGYYELKAIEGGKRTLLTIEMHSDPKGLIPAWVVNLFQKDWARETIAGIRKQVQKRDLKPPAPFAQFLDDCRF